MKLFRHPGDVTREMPGAVYALGNFDGLHLGHRAVIEQARSIARATGAPYGVLTFEPHPRSYFVPTLPPFRLTPFRAKMHQLQALGCDLAVVLHFDRSFAAVTADGFARDILHEGLRAREIVVGYDFVYGHDREGNAARLTEAGRRLGFGVTIVAPVTAGEIAYSSTQIRQHLQAGEVEAAARLLGRPWEVEGRVETGAALGREIGFPTANLALADYLRPAFGIYAVKVGIERIGGVDWHDGVGYVGTRPVVEGTTLRLEVNLFDFSGDLYGRHLRVQFIGWIRPDRNFDGLAALQEQIRLDAQQARAVLAAGPADF